MDLEKSRWKNKKLNWLQPKHNISRNVSVINRSCERTIFIWSAIRKEKLTQVKIFLTAEELHRMREDYEREEDKRVHDITKHTDIEKKGCSQMKTRDDTRLRQDSLKLIEQKQTLDHTIPKKSRQTGMKLLRSKLSREKVRISKINYDKGIEWTLLKMEWTLLKNALKILLIPSFNTKCLKKCSLLSHLYKFFRKIKTNTLAQKLDLYQPVEQAGFIKGYTTIDHLQPVGTRI